ncbi:MAG: DUF4163 domain-containing protein [Candidatus Marinimicrobia bacterium]|nr:DUF4163 domain-containing protein [Candidatus Neomarinimicrobiota bacterium]
MRKKNMLLLAALLAGLLLNSCTKFKNSLENKHKSCYRLVHQKSTNGSEKKDNGVNMDLQYPVFDLWSDAAVKINNTITANIFSKAGLETIQDTLSYNGYLQAIRQKYQKLKQDFPDAVSISFKQKTRCKITTFTESVVSVYISNYVFSGGAHGMEYREYLNFDPNSGEQIDIINSIEDKKIFVYLAETKLREKLNMQTYDNWSEHTFLQEFKLPKNIGMTDTSYKLIYNQYELMAYSEGPTEIEINFKELKY